MGAVFDFIILFYTSISNAAGSLLRVVNNIGDFIEDIVVKLANLF